MSTSLPSQNWVLCTLKTLLLMFLPSYIRWWDPSIDGSVQIYLQNLSTDKVVVVPITAGIPQILSPSPRYYRGSCPYFRGNAAVIVPIPRYLPRLPRYYRHHHPHVTLYYAFNAKIDTARDMNDDRHCCGGSWRKCTVSVTAACCCSDEPDVMTWRDAHAMLSSSPVTRPTLSQ